MDKSAKKVQIQDIVNGEYIETEEKDVLKTNTGEEISTARVMATVVDKFISEDFNYGVLTLDDSTETIGVKAFKKDVNKLNGIEIGDIVDVVGRISEYENELYISLKSIKKITDPNWELLRKLELLQSKKGVGKSTVINLNEMVLKKIKELDNGDGVHIKDLKNNLKEANDEEILSTIRDLLFRGEIFEPNPNHLKIVE